MSEQEQQSFIEGNQLDEDSSPKEKESDGEIGGLTRNIFSPSQTLNVLGMGSENIDNISWQDFNEYLHILDPVSMKNNPYKELELFEPGEVNIGLCLVYRQEWRPLGNQRGEIIRTIPLGPKQLEKVSTKIVRRTKVTKTAETLKSIESTKEASDTVKDSSEIINEAAETSGMQASVSGSINAGWASVKASAGMQKNSENRSKNLSSKLSETMQKTAGKIRSETKTMVSTESESAYEMTTASEIQNPNEEIAITYVYSKLQRQYEIFTSLAEIHPVVMVPLPIPAPGEIDEKWIRKYDWILAKVLLDDSYRDALTYISQNPVDIGAKPSKTGNVLASFNTIRSESDLSKLAPILKDGQAAFMDMLKQNIEQENQRRVMEYKCERLKDHLKDNILHYYQAIWSQQDSEQQLLKLKKSGIKVPAKWKFIGKFGDTEYGDDVFKNTIYDLLSEVIDYQFKQLEIDEATFEKEVGEGLKRLEDDLIAERDSNIEKERELITQNYVVQIGNMIKEENTKCEEEIKDRKAEIRARALKDSGLEKLDKDIADLTENLIGDIGKVNDSFNNKISQIPYSNYWIKEKLKSESPSGIKDWSDRCLKVVKESPKELLENPAHKNAWKNYKDILYPRWIKEIKNAEQKQAKLKKDTDDLVNSLIKDINNRNNEYNGKIKKEIFGKHWIKEKLKTKNLSGVKDWCNRCCNFVKHSPSVLAFHFGYGKFRPKYMGPIYRDWMKRIENGEKNQARLQREIAILTRNLIRDIGNANNTYNDRVSQFPAHFRINERLRSENLSEIKDWFDRCLTAVKKSPGFPAYPTYENTRTNYIKANHPGWIKEIENGEKKQADLNALNNSVFESIASEQEETATEIKGKYETALAENTAILNSERDGKIDEVRRDITEFYAAEIPKRKKWLRKKLIRELKEDIEFEGDFVKFSADDIKKMKLSPQKAEVDITEIMNPAGPIAYHGNYAVYYLKPEVQSSDLLTILTVMKTPYLYYTSRDKAPTLVDPLFKRYLKDYDDVVPSMNDRYEMVEYVPDLRLMLTLAQEDSRTFVPESPDDRDPIEKLLIDDKLFTGYYSEYLFRKELTRRFVVDTNNIILDIERGRGSALEPFRLAHRGIDVQKAVEERDKLKLENKRMKELIAQKQLDSRFWPDAQKFVAFTGGNGMQYGITTKPTAEDTAPELTAVPIITPEASPEETNHHAKIFGRVEKGKNHEPVKGAEVKIICLKKGAPKSIDELEKEEVKSRIKTSANGAFFTELEDGKYQVLATAPKFKSVSSTVELKKEQPKELLFTLQPVTSSSEYIGNKKTMELHKPDCSWIDRVNSQNKIEFKSIKEATNKGYNKCRHCMG